MRRVKRGSGFNIVLEGTLCLNSQEFSSRLWYLEYNTNDRTYILKDVDQKQHVVQFNTIEKANTTIYNFRTRKGLYSFTVHDSTKDMRSAREEDRPLLATSHDLDKFIEYQKLLELQQRQPTVTSTMIEEYPEWSAITTDNNTYYTPENGIFKDIQMTTLTSASDVADRYIQTKKITGKTVEKKETKNAIIFTYNSESNENIRYLLKHANMCVVPHILAKHYEYWYIEGRITSHQRNDGKTLIHIRTKNMNSTESFEVCPNGNINKIQNQTSVTFQ